MYIYNNEKNMKTKKSKQKEDIPIFNYTSNNILQKIKKNSASL